MKELQLPAPVKINLFLHILGRRADGYHELQTLFQLLDAGDELSFSLRSDGAIRFQCSEPSLQGEQNLVVKAAKALQRCLQQQCLQQQRLQTPLGADIKLNKKMPVGGGIGGGSSDAATALLGLNHLWKGGLSIEQLLELGRSLGADVPVFVQGRTAWAEGVGEKLQLIDLKEVWYLVLTPDVAVSTAAIFAHPDLTRDSAAITVAAFFEQGTLAQKGLKTAFLRNDCQQLVATLYPKVAEVIDWLNQFATAQMTGTGASVFAPFETEFQAREVLAKSPWSGFVAKGINQSPVHQLLER